MPPYLPIMGLERSPSRNVRIGDQTLKFGTITYVDVGTTSNVGLPTATAVANSSTGPGLTASTKYYYVVTATDEYGGETASSPEVAVESGAGDNASGAKHNVNTVSWTAVPGAVNYNVYRGTVSGEEKFRATVATNKFVDSGQAAETNANGNVAPPTTNNTFSRSGKGVYSSKQDLKSHSAIGAFLVVGPLTKSNSDFVIVGATDLALTISSLEIKVAAGELRQRSTAEHFKISAGNTTLAAASSTEDRTDLVWVNPITNTVGKTAGTLAAVGTSVAPAAPAGVVPVGTFLVAKSASAATLVADIRPRA